MMAQSCQNAGWIFKELWCAKRKKVPVLGQANPCLLMDLNGIASTASNLACALQYTGWFQTESWTVTIKQPGQYDPAVSVVEDEDQEDELVLPTQEHCDKCRLTAEMIDIVNAPIAVRDLVARKGRFNKQIRKQG